MASPALPERYHLLEELGEGATCTVYKADDAVLGHPVAIKVVRPNLAIHARFRARFDREVALSAQVIHPRVIPVYDAGRLEDGRPFVTLACADSGSLSDLLETQPTLTEALRLIDQVLEALSAMHAMGLLHQDLKPANVLLHPATPGMPMVQWMPGWRIWVWQERWQTSPCTSAASREPPPGWRPSSETVGMLSSARGPISTQSG